MIGHVSQSPTWYAAADSRNTEIGNVVLMGTEHHRPADVEEVRSCNLQCNCNVSLGDVLTDALAAGPMLSHR
jgi:hypothetical protein